MKSNQQHNNSSDEKNKLHEEAAENSLQKREEEKLREAVYLSDMEKFRLFTKMLRTNALYKKIIVTHKT